jgi:hypothetical protein
MPSKRWVLSSQPRHTRMRDMGWVPPWTDRIQGGAAGAAHNAARLIPIRSKRYEGSKGERIDKMNPIQGVLRILAVCRARRFDDSKQYGHSQDQTHQTRQGCIKGP